MSELNEECGVVAVYHLPGDAVSPLCPGGSNQATRLLPRMLLDIQNRGQLAAGISTYHPGRSQLLDTHKDVGSVAEVFRLSHQGKRDSLMQRYDGPAGIGHVRYATCGKDDRSYAQPFERHHLLKHKWFSFAFNGQLANYHELREKLLQDDNNHLTRETDTEIIMHELGHEFSREGQPLKLLEVIQNVSNRFDGAYSLAMINAHGEMIVSRDPLGIKPMCYARQGPLFAAASESVALANLGFAEQNIQSLQPGYAVTVSDGQVKIERYAQSPRRAHCFFEWIYFANVASTLDDRSVYLVRTALGEELARLELEDASILIDEDTIVVPVPDTSKAAADSMAFHLGVPSREGLIRNRYSGRTFIEGSDTRRKAVEMKYTPLRQVLEGKRVILVEDSIVRSTTMRVLLDRIRKVGGAQEIHVRVACPPIVAPCFYGIDMSTIDELFAPRFLGTGLLTREVHEKMAEALGANSLRYLPVEAIATAVRMESDSLCQACISREYPTVSGQQLYQLAEQRIGHEQGRTYESVVRT